VRCLCVGCVPRRCACGYPLRPADVMWSWEQHVTGIKQNTVTVFPSDSAVDGHACPRPDTGDPTSTQPDKRQGIATVIEFGFDGTDITDRPASDLREGAGNRYFLAVGLGGEHRFSLLVFGLRRRPMLEPACRTG